MPPGRAATKRHFDVEVKRAADELINGKRQKIDLITANKDVNAIYSGVNSASQTSSRSAPLSPLPERRESRTDVAKKTNQKVQSVGPYRFVASLEENGQSAFTAVDTRCDGRLMICRRLDRSKYQHIMQLSHRLTTEINDVTVSDEEASKRAYQQIFPETSEMIVGDDGHFYYVEPKNYGSLHAYVVERKRLSEKECLYFFQQILALLVFCHRRRVVMRDLKLRKFVFADPERRTLRLDGIDELFVCPDLPREEEESPDDKITDRHGCPAYVGPEILDLKKKSYSGRAADVWSLGVLLYVMLYGRYPFYDTTPARLFAKIRHAHIYLMEEAGISFEARSMIRCLLRRDPSERPAAFDILAHPWLQSRDQVKNMQRQRCIIGGSMVSGMRMAMADKHTESDQCVPCVDVEKCDAGRKTKNGSSREGRVNVSGEPAVPSQ